MLEAYKHAVAEKYRFYSYGDCMFVEFDRQPVLSRRQRAIYWSIAEEGMGTQALAKQVPIEDFVAGLRKFSGSLMFRGTEQIFQFLERTPVAPDTLERYLTWDRQHYTRNLIDKTPVYV